MGGLTKDNTSLYGKIKYLQSYNGMAKARHADLEIGLEDPTIAKYKNSYEEGMNPFEFFTKSERQLQMQKLSAPEKIALSGTKFIVSNKYARHFAFFYALFMHTLVFVSFFHAAHGNHSQCCPCSHAEILKGFHGR